MLPRELGGVVSPELKVYGTSNVRVLDASVLPFQVCGHLTSTLYAMAEKAADIIKAAGWKVGQCGMAISVNASKVILLPGFQFLC